MKCFVHTAAAVTIINEAKRFTCAPATWQQIAPEYAGQPDIFWTPGLKIPSDAPDCSAYILNIDAYLPVGSIYAHLELSQSRICATNPADAATFTARLKPSLDPTSDDLPVTQDWIVSLIHQNQVDRDSFRLAFVNGACSYTYRARAGQLLGDWHVNADEFTLVPVGAAVYTVKLAQPVLLTIYRELD